MCDTSEPDISEKSVGRLMKWFSPAHSHSRTAATSSSFHGISFYPRYPPPAVGVMCSAGQYLGANAAQSATALHCIAAARTAPVHSTAAGGAPRLQLIYDWRLRLQFALQTLISQPAVLQCCRISAKPRPGRDNHSSVQCCSILSDWDNKI